MASLQRVQEVEEEESDAVVWGGEGLGCMSTTGGVGGGVDQ